MRLPDCIQDLESHRQAVILEPPAPNLLHVRLLNPRSLSSLAPRLNGEKFTLVDMIGSDERRLIDRCFKVYYLFSHSEEDQFLLIESPAVSSITEADEAHDAAGSLSRGVEYVSVAGQFSAAAPFESELADMMGLFPERQERLTERHSGIWLPAHAYPPALYPLRRDHSSEQLTARLELYHSQRKSDGADWRTRDGEWLLPVGPVHAGVIEPGQFIFRLAGEVVENLTIHLGYTHKGIERLFQTHASLADGWHLAEHVAGDACFAHSLAYCQAVEALARAEAPRAAQYIRVFFLELERTANHINDCAALAHDVACNVLAADLAELREHVMRLCRSAGGHRLLRGICRPGGVVLETALESAALSAALESITRDFSRLSTELRRNPGLRERLQWTGILTRRQALELGVTGLAARASGIQRDSRTGHPAGAYNDPAIYADISAGLPSRADTVTARESTAGDALARLLVRLQETRTSLLLLAALLRRPELNTGQQAMLTLLDFSQTPNYSVGIGHAESWRGDVIYFLMKDQFERIFRCKVRDASMLNWPGLRAAVEPHDLDGEYQQRHHPPSARAELILADFPVVNKSFNLSYSANDL